MVECEPTTATVVVKGDRKRNAYHKEHCQHELIVDIYDRKRRHVSQKDYQLGRDHIYQDGTDEEAFFSLEDRLTRRALVFNSKGPLEDGRVATHRTPEQKAPAQEVRKRRTISPHK